MIAEFPERIEGRPIEIRGYSVLILYPRRWWVPFKAGWHRHVDGLGRRCWIRYDWPGNAT
jgi:hypothetical protein